MTRDVLPPAAIHFTGRACRLPMADTVEEFTELLFSGACAVTEIPERRWRKDPFFHPVPGVKGKSYSFAAGALRAAEAFDPAPFGISPREADYMDPQQRLMLQVVWEALEDACIPPAEIAGTNTGVFIGASMMDHGGVVGSDPELSDGYVMTGSALSVIANRVSHVFDLHGPSLTIDTACSSSLFALEAAAKALRLGEIDTAIVGATNLLMSPNFFVGFSEARMLSPTGLCQAFSDEADGYVRGEGAVAFVLRRREPGSEPLPRDHGRLVHVGVNTTGRSVNIAMPSADAQFALLDRVYREAGVDPDRLAFVEAHGTGTPVGDPIEADALGRALGRRRSAPLPIGSVKSNVGHLEPAAGCAGLLKALLALEHRKLPASLHTKSLNNAIAFDDLNLSVAQSPVALDLDDPDQRLAGISAFGFGGANAHAIIEAPEPVNVEPVIVPMGAAVQERIFLTSAFCDASLNASAAAYRDRVFKADGRPDTRLMDALIHFRGEHPSRAAVIAADQGTVGAAIDALGRGEKHPALVRANCGLSDQPPVYLFSGNGAQYAGMSLAALEADPTFRAAYEEIDAAWHSLSGWSLLDKVRDPGLADQIRAADIAQPLLFAEQVATVAALRARGAAPMAVLGHSGGEVAAAAVSGALTMTEALGVLFARAMAQRELAGLGTMAALQISEDEAAAVLAEADFGGVTISAVNSPRSVTVSAPLAAMDAFQKHARRKLRWAMVRLKVDYAFHHAMQDGSEEIFRNLLSDLSPKKARIPFISSVTGVVADGARLDGDYWWRNVRQPVRFADAIATAAGLGHRCFVEIGPDPVLGAYARDCLRELPDETLVTHSTTKADSGGLNPITLGVARLLVGGARLDRGRIARRPRRAVPGLQTYPWQNREMRAYDRADNIKRMSARSDDYHPLLGREIGEEARIWSREIDLHLAPELADHKIAGKVLVPGTAFAEMALSAAQRTLGQSQIELRDLDMSAPLILTSKALAELRTRVVSPGATVRIESRPRFGDENWLEHASCRALALASGSGSGCEQDAAADTAPDPAQRPADLDGARLYDFGAEIGLDYGPEFRAVERYRLLDDDVVEVILKARPGPTDGAAALDPVAADAVLHGLIGYLEKGRFADALLGFLPVRIGRLRLHRPGRAIRTGRIAVHRVGERSLLADISLFDEGGALIAELKGMRFRAARLLQQIQFDAHAFGFDLVPVDPGQPDAALSGSAIVAALVAKAPDGDPANDAHGGGSDDAPLLLDAIAYRAAHNALAAFTDANGLVQVPENARPDTLRLVSAIGQILEASGLAAHADEGLKISAESGLPEVAVLISGLLAERPELGPECALLAHLNGVLGPILTGALDWTPDAVFGRAALSNLSAGSASREQRNKSLINAVLPQLAAAPERRPLRIAEIVFDRPVLLDRLASMAPGPVDAVILAGENVQSSPLALSNCRVRRFALSDIADAGSFDLIVASAPAIAPISEEDLCLAAAALRPGGAAIVLTGEDRDHLELIATLADPSGARGLQPSTDQGAVKIARLVLPGAGNAMVAYGAEQTKSVAAPLADEPISEAAHEGIGSAEGPGMLTALRGTLTAASGADGLALIHHAEPNLWALVPDGAGGKAPAPIAVLAPDRAPDGAGDHVLRARLLHLAALLHALPAGGAPIWFILPGGASYSGAPAVSPVQTALWATLRTAKNEYPGLDLKAVDPGDQPDDCSARRIVELMASATAETEFVLTPDGPSALRIRQGTRDCVLPEGGRACLTVDPGGGLDSLAWRRAPMPEPGPNEVLVEVEATGLNYRDVMWSMGLLPEEALERGLTGPTLGMECAGRIAALGADVDGLSIGDRVVAIGPSSFASHVAVDRDWTLPLPTGLTAEAGASLPVAFFTAYYGLTHLAHLSAGETVLIHGGAGGVGLAAIQVARTAGARIIATAGSGVKRSLLETLGVDAIADSRSADFETDVLRHTGGAGVDVVLNSLSGISMERSIALMRPFGRFVELGKQDFYANTAVGLRPFKDNISYFSADLDQLLKERPTLAQDIYRRMLERFEAGEFGPVPFRTFDGADVIEAFRAMQRSDHIGKIVVRPPRPASVRKAEAVPVFHPKKNGTLVIAGGGSGLGLAHAERMVTLDAGAIALLGRSQTPSGQVRALIKRAAARGNEVSYIPCDIANPAALEQALSAIRARRPITDIVHSAMVLDDMRMADLTNDVLERSMAAKMSGARNLDMATRGDPIRTFVVFTSLATLIGNHGQAAYVAANAYMEGIVHRRRVAGLPGLAVGWGAITDAGYLARNKERARLVRRMGGNVDFQARQALRALDLLSGDGQTQSDDCAIWISPMNWQATAQGLRLLQGPTHRALWDLGQQSGGTIETDDLREEVLGMSLDEASLRLSAFVKREIARILRTGDAGIPTNRPVSDIGVDSLMGVELGLAAQQALGDDIPMMTISSANSIDEIAEKIAEHIHSAEGGGFSSHNLLNDLVAQHVTRTSPATEDAPARATAAE